MEFGLHTFRSRYSLSKPRTRFHEFTHAFIERPDLVWLFGVSISLNGVLWAIVFWLHQTMIYIPIFGVGVILLHLSLAIVFIRKESVITQALGVTAISIQLLLLVLVIRS